MSIVAARVLGPEQMGRQSFIAFVTLIATSLCAAGLPAALTRSVGLAAGRGDQGAIAGLVRAGWLVEFALALVGTGALLVAMAAGAQPRAAWGLAALTVFAGALATVPLAALSGTHEWKAYSVPILVTNIVSTGLTLGALAVGWGITGIVGARFVQTLAVTLWVTVVLRAVLRRGAPTAPRREPVYEREMLRYAAASSFSVLLTLVVYLRTELFFLNHFSSDVQIAHYAIASSALTILLAAPLALGIALGPALSNLHGAGEFDRIRVGYSRVLRVSILVSLPTMGLAAIVGPRLLLLFYGASYSGVQAVFLMLLPSLVAVPLISASAAVLTAHGQVRAPLLGFLAAAATDLLAAYELVPRYGALGAAAASVMAFIVAASFLGFSARRTVRWVDIDKRSLLFAAVASVTATCAGLGVLFIGSAALVLVPAVGSFILVFAMLARTMGVARDEDARWLVGVAGRIHPRASRIVALVLRPSLSME